MDIRDALKLFGITPPFKEEQVKSAYKKLVLKYHPDRNQGKNTEKFIEIQKAHETILKFIEYKKKQKQQRTRVVIRVSPQYANFDSATTASSSGGFTFTWNGT